jgi:hypothetical protein
LTLNSATTIFELTLFSESVMLGKLEYLKKMQKPLEWAYEITASKFIAVQ